MNEEKVVVKSTVNGRVGITLPDYRFKQEWNRKGAKANIDKQILNDIMFEPGVDYMFKTGILYIENMETKKELGLEPQDAKEPENIIVLDENQMKRQLSLVPFHEFKTTMEKLSKEQRMNLVQFAVQQEILPSMEKTDLLQKATGVDIVSAIRLNRANKE